MDRRVFLRASLTGLLTYNWSCARACAATTTTLYGCRMAATGKGTLGVTLIDPPQGLDYLIGGGPPSTRAMDYTLWFGLRVGMRFYDDGGAPNALACPIAILPDKPDGTVLLGANLFQRESQKSGSGIGSYIPLHAIIAHEFAHIMQYKNGMTPEGPWQMEPHADFMAGWYLGAKLAAFYYEREGHYLKGFPTPQESTQEQLEKTIRTFFQIGDYAFNDRTHHGEPEFRAAMVRAGYESRDLDVNEAFEKGKKYAGLS